MRIKKQTLYKISAGLLLFLPLIALAQTPEVDFKELIRGIFRIIGLVLGLIALAQFGLAIYMLMTSSGDPKKLDEAKVKIVWAIVAVLLAAALFRMEYILGFFGIRFT